ncbi:ATP-binding cassette domain-containing protein [Conexibacter stalactiti]|uniref:ATP-binding cassette domain-containing protein n=1 Tax=Conexibacter stalactiti TaxID=1940611 RepID=A0ABU4HTF5_9ACTN|nr:ATP-binding cassette domain-containing protein [Conexibacter stalactiti]MDW5596597.1 ATP-binding cassette domain-containing protein [Conexibacter stalactiti]MEC5037239.1 ATP-binding cassette domain-containing protein [Conexibacter stalactiti]
MNVLELSGVGKRYGGVEVLRDVSLSVRAGSVTALIGPNGAGKSTLANVASGIVRPDSGTVTLGGRDVTRTTTWRRASLGLGRTFQNLELFEGLTVLENVMVGAHAHGLSRRALREAALAALERFSIGHLAQRRVESLSFGEAKLVEPARMLVGRPSVAILDEPAAGLPPASADELAGRIAALSADGLAVLLIEHDVPLVMRLSDHVVVLVGGAVLTEGPPATVREDQRVIDAYLGVEDE